MQDFSKSHQTLIWVAAALTLIGLGPFRQEIDPWAGTYDVVSVEPSQGDWSNIADHEPLMTGAWRSWGLTIYSDRRIETGYYSWCGSCPDDLISGESKREGSLLKVMDTPMPYKVISPHPLLILEVRGRQILREMPLGDGRSVKLVFGRTENASTMLDYVGFR